MGKRAHQFISLRILSLSNLLDHNVLSQIELVNLRLPHNINCIVKLLLRDGERGTQKSSHNKRMFFLFCLSTHRAHGFYTMFVYAIIVQHHGGGAARMKNLKWNGWYCVMPVYVIFLSRHFCQSVCATRIFLWFFVRHHRNKMGFLYPQRIVKASHTRTPAHTLILPVLHIHDELYLRCKQMNTNVSCCLHALQTNTHTHAR